MANNAQKTWFGLDINRFAQQKAASAIQQTGRALPASVTAASGAIVTVKFEINAAPFTLPNVTVPLVGSEYIRLPIQVGCKGIVIPADTRIGNISGLGGGVPDLSVLANLSALVFVPVGNSGWSTTDDVNAVVIYGPDGTIIRSIDKSVMLKVTKTENSWTAPNSTPATIKGNLVVEGNLLIGGLIKAQDGSTYSGSIETAGAVIAGFGSGDQVGLQTHTHTQPDDSHGDTEQPTAAPTGGT